MVTVEMEGRPELETVDTSRHGCNKWSGQSDFGLTTFSIIGAIHMYTLSTTCAGDTNCTHYVFSQFIMEHEMQRKDCFQISSPHNVPLRLVVEIMYIQ